MGIVTKRAGISLDKMFKVFKPFAPSVWGCIVVSVLAAGLILYAVNRFSPYTAYNDEEQSDDSPDQVHLTSNLWIIFSSYMEQGIPDLMI